MRVLDRQQVPGGWLVRVEVPGAFVRADGTPEAGERRVFVRAEQVAGRAAEDVLELLADALEEDPFGQVVGAHVVRPQQAPVRAERRAERLAELSRRWVALDSAAKLAATDGAFTAGERTRLATARDAARAALRATL